MRDTFWSTLNICETRRNLPNLGQTLAKMLQVYRPISPCLTISVYWSILSCFKIHIFQNIILFYIMIFWFLRILFNGCITLVSDSWTPAMEGRTRPSWSPRWSWRWRGSNSSRSCAPKRTAALHRFNQLLTNRSLRFFRRFPSQIYGTFLRHLDKFSQKRPKEAFVLSVS